MKSALYYCCCCIVEHTYPPELCLTILHLLLERAGCWGGIERKRDNMYSLAGGETAFSEHRAQSTGCASMGRANDMLP